MEDGLLEREQLGVLRRARGGAARGSGEQGQLAQHFARPQERDRDRLRGVRGRGQDLEHARLDDVELVALVALAEDDGAGPVVLHATLHQDGLQDLVGLVLEQV